MKPFDECYRQLLSSNPNNLPNAVTIGDEVLSMPSYGGLNEDDVRKVCKLLKSMREVVV